MGKILVIFLVIMNKGYLGKFFLQVVCQIDWNLYLVPIFKVEFGKHISILTIILRNALL